ncbi:MAG TPA: M28 family peptidase, partial [Longimicrobiales bacterium]|nr:M28 family peptidase [Longimicrobiales bacterium]
MTLKGAPAAPVLVAALATACGAGAGGAPAPDGFRAPPAPPAALDSPGLRGFTQERTPVQRHWERRLLAVPSAGHSDLARWLTAEPHMAGTRRQQVLADSLAGWLRGLGFEVRVDRYDAYLPHPDTLALELSGADPHAFTLREGDPDDPHSWTWNAFSANGRAAGRAVYANYGRAADFDALEAAGVDVVGAVALIRYGGVYRGAKVREAERRGVAGVVLYPDPANDGFARGDTLPDGPFRPTSSVQRGTVSYMWRYTGDPLTPGRPARPGVPRLDPEEASTLPSIPVLNINGAQALRVLEGLGGPEAPESFRGGWPVTYRLGGGDAELRMLVRQRFRQRPVRNVVARIPGRDGPDAQAVILGAHFDAWLYGGVDAQSGGGVIQEVARGLAALRSDGWEPRRDIVLAFWGGEEFGVVGSTEFVEDRLVWLRERAVAYFNIDVFTAGALHVSGSPSLRDVVWDAALDVADPVTGRPLAHHWAERGGGADSRVEPPHLPAVGLGSDWTAFLHFAGVPSLQWTMNGRGTYAVYHSVYDTFDYLTTWADSAGIYTPAMARVMGLAAIRLAEADALPFSYAYQARRLARQVDALAVERAGASAMDGLGEVRAALAELVAAAEHLETRRDSALAVGDAAFLQSVNRALPRVEAAFLDSGSADWYHHLLYGPDPATGYGSILLPAIQPHPGTGRG